MMRKIFIALISLMIIFQSLQVSAATNLVQQQTFKAIAIATGGGTSFVLRNDGTLWSWGNNDYGQLGDGTMTPKNKPVQVKGLKDIIAVVATSTCKTSALKRDGTVWIWGCMGGSTPTPIPQQVKGLKNVVRIYGVANNFYAALKDGTVVPYYTTTFTGDWIGDDAGSNGYGLLFTDKSGKQKFHPIKIDASSRHHIALLKDGTLLTWSGWKGVPNLYGEIGDGSDKYREGKYKVNLNNVVDITAAERANIVLRKDGTLWTWGGNNNGVIGETSNPNIQNKLKREDNKHADSIIIEYRSVPSQMKGIKDVKKVSCNGSSCLAIKTDGTVWAWGDHTFGQLGNGKPATPPIWKKKVNGSNSLLDEYVIQSYSNPLPVQVTGLIDIVDVSTSGIHSLALKRDGSVWAWGSSRQLGNGENGSEMKKVDLGDGRYYFDVSYKSVPIQVLGFGPIHSPIQNLTSNHSISTTNVSLVTNNHAVQSQETVVMKDEQLGQKLFKLGNGSEITLLINNYKIFLSDYTMIQNDLYVNSNFIANGLGWYIPSWDDKKQKVIFTKGESKFVFDDHIGDSLDESKIALSAVIKNLIKGTVTIDENSRTITVIN
jgi:alpha-tubulin suppressor-like RCC1 family protein